MAKIISIFKNTGEADLNFTFFKNNNGGGIKFDNGVYLLDKFLHLFDQDHKVYWEVLEGTDIMTKDFDLSNINFLQKIPNIGFKIISTDGTEYQIPIKIKNGIRLDNKTFLVICENSGSMFFIDVSDCVEKI